jgi:hypothetical protein
VVASSDGGGGGGGGRSAPEEERDASSLQESHRPACETPGSASLVGAAQVRACARACVRERRRRRACTTRAQTFSALKSVEAGKGAARAQGATRARRADGGACREQARQRGRLSSAWCAACVR